MSHVGTAGACAFRSPLEALTNRLRKLQSCYLRIIVREWIRAKRTPKWVARQFVSYHGAFMKKFLLLSAALLLAVPSAASAAVTLTSEPGSDPYVGPAPTFDFENPTPEYVGGAVRDTSPSGLSAQPFGSTGKYATSGPGDGIGTLSLAAFGDIDWISFIWGSIDTFNTLEVLNAGGGIIASFTGTSVIAAANGNQSNPATNRLVKLTFTDADRTSVDSLRFRSTSNAFEFDKVAVAAAVPEPTTWMLMLMGIAGIGFTMRRKRDTTLRVRFA